MDESDDMFADSRDENDIDEEDDRISEKLQKKKNVVQTCENCGKENNEFVPIDNLKFNDYFFEAYVRRAIADFSDKFFHPFQVKSTEQDNPEKGVRAKIVYKCTHGVDRAKRGAAKIRQRQHHNYTGCVAGVTVRRQNCGRWAVRTCIPPASLLT